MLDLCNRPRPHTIALDRDTVRVLGRAAGGRLRERFSRIQVAIRHDREPTSWRGVPMPGEHRDRIDLTTEELLELMGDLCRWAFWSLDPRPMPVYRRLRKQFPFATSTLSLYVRVTSQIE